MHPTIGTLAERLRTGDVRARRIAVMDLARHPDRSGALALALAHAAAELDKNALLTLARFLGEHGAQTEMTGLARLRDDPSVDIEVYHAALLAHDRIELRLRASGADAVPSGPARADAP